MTLRTAIYELWARNKALNLDVRGWGVTGCYKKLVSMGLDPTPVYFRNLVKKDYGREESYACIFLGNDGQEKDKNWSPGEDFWYTANDLWKWLKKYLTEDKYQNISVMYGFRTGYNDQDRYEIVAKGKSFNQYSQEWETGKTWQNWEEEWIRE